MATLDTDDQYYVLRQNDFFDGNSAGNPRLYTQVLAVREAKRRNKIPNYITSGLWEAVPVDFTLGDPVDL